MRTAVADDEPERTPRRPAAANVSVTGGSIFYRTPPPRFLLTMDLPDNAVLAHDGQAVFIPGPPPLADPASAAPLPAAFVDIGYTRDAAEFRS